MRRVFRKPSIPFFALLMLTAVQLAPHVVQAASQLTVTPVVVDEKAKAQDILNESITIQNTSDQLEELYPSVNDVQDQSGEQPFSYAQNASQASASLSNWIELSRGVIQLGPGEQQTIPFLVRVPTNAVAASYHAVISFTNGATRDQAAAQGALAMVTVNVDLQADIKELMQLNAFSTDNVVFSGDDVLFKYQLQNIGNQSLDPKGQISIYDRNGEEVASIDVNTEGKIISPDQVTQLASVWSAASGFGKYKAVIDVDYGTDQVASVQDIAYFWIIPWKQVLGLSIMSLIALIFVALYFHRWLEEQHFGKLAAAGLIKAEALVHRAPPPPPPKPPAAPVVPPLVRAEQAALRIKASIGEKKQQFSEFKRTGFLPPKAGSRLPPEPAAEAKAQTLAVSDTIDLKQMWKQEPPPPPPEHHVINLKDT